MMGIYPTVSQVTAVAGGTASGSVRVRVAGDVDENSAPVLAAALREVAASKQTPGLQVDMSAVTAFSSGDVNALLAARHAAGGHLTGDDVDGPGDIVANR